MDIGNSVEGVLYMSKKLRTLVKNYKKVAEKVKKCDDTSCAEERLEIERQIMAELTKMYVEEEHLDFDDIITILEVSNPYKHTFKSLIFAIEKTNSPISVDIMDYILTYSATVTMNADSYKDIIYLMSKTIDALTGNIKLSQTVTEVYQ